MANWIKPGHRLGIIGSGSDTTELVLAAKKLGYVVSTYNQNNRDGSGEVSDFYTQGRYDDYDSLMTFAQSIDVLIYTTREIDSEIIKQLSAVTNIPQGDYLLALSQDKILRKSILEAAEVVVPPQEIIVSKDDLYTAVENIGFPAVLKSNSSWNESFQYVMFYDESDIDAFDFEAAHIPVGVLEAWVPVERELSVVASVDNEKNIFPVTLSETTYRDGKLYRSFNPPQVDDDVAVQMFYIAQKIAEIEEFYGVITVEFLLTSAGVIYVKDIIPFVSPSAAYTKYAQNLSQYDMAVRSAVKWPIPSVMHYGSAVMIEFYENHLDKVLAEIESHPQWLIDLYSGDLENEAIGRITVVSDDNNQALQDFSEVDLWHNINERK